MFCEIIAICLECFCAVINLVFIARQEHAARLLLKYSFLLSAPMVSKYFEV